VERVLLVVPVHNRLGELKELLSSLRSLHLEGLELSVAIVDDASLDPVPKKMEDEYSDLNPTVIRSNNNIGPAGARNIALKNSDADFFWFLDSDAEIDDPQVLKNMIRILRAHHEIGTVGGVVEQVSGEWKVFEPVLFLNTLVIPQYLPRKDYSKKFVSVICTANLLVLRKVFELTNGFDEKLPRNEDEDLCLTLKKFRYQNMQSEETLVRHKLSKSGRDSGAFAHFGDSKKYLSDLLKTRSLLIFKHNPWKLVILPILDVLTLMELFIGSKSNSLKLVRFGMVNKGRRFANFLNLPLISIYYYFYGWLLLLKIKTP
jgi:GT2 family glycosyltransferase